MTTLNQNFLQLKNWWLSNVFWKTKRKYNIFIYLVSNLTGRTSQNILGQEPRPSHFVTGHEIVFFNLLWWLFNKIYLIQFVSDNCWRQAYVWRWLEGIRWCRNKFLGLNVLFAVKYKKMKYFAVMEQIRWHLSLQQNYEPSHFSKMFLDCVSTRWTRSNDKLELNRGVFDSGISIYMMDVFPGSCMTVDGKVSCIQRMLPN